MKRRFTILTAALALLVSLAIPMGMWGQETVTATSTSMTASVSYQDLETGKLIEYKNSASNSYSNPLRIYSGNTFTIHAKEGVEKITQIAIVANSTSYANATGSATWTAIGEGSCSATASVSGSNVTVAITGTATTVTCKPSAQIRWNQLSVTYVTTGTPPAITYTMTYNANGGTGTMTDDNSPYDANATVTVLDNEFTRDHFDFVKWNTKADGTGTDYDEGDTFTISDNTTLYAQWESDGTGGEGSICFSNQSSCIAINSQSVTGEDNLGNTWTITTTGTSSFTANSGYYQVGSGSSPATSITFTTTLDEEVNVTDFSAMFGGFNATRASVVLKVDNTQVGSGTLNGGADVTVGSSSPQIGTTLTVIVTPTAGGVKCYNISYAYETITPSQAVNTTTTIDVPANFNTDIYQGTTAGTLSATVSAEGTPISGAIVTWSSSNTGVATIDANGAVTLVAVGTTTITASYAGVTDQYRPSSATYSLEVTDSTPVFDATFIFNTDEGLADLNITKPNAGSGTDLDANHDYVIGIVTMNVTHASTPTRIWGLSGGATELRAYSGSTLTFRVPSGYAVTKVTFTGSALPYSELTNGVWTSTGDPVSTVTFNCTNTAKVSTITVEYEENASIVAAPTLPASTNFYPEMTVEITNNTSGATVYYTTDGSNPKTSNTRIEYTQAFTLNATTTVKAVALKDSNYSQVVEATYTLVDVLDSMQDVFNAAGDETTNVFINFNNYVVSGVSTNGKSVFVTDNSGNGFVIFNNNGGLDQTYSVGSILSGTAVPCNLVKYNGFAELLNVDASNLTITTGGTVSTSNIAMADLAGVNTGALVSYENLTCSVDDSGDTPKYYLTDGTTTLQVYNSLYAFNALENGKKYNITGVYQQYNNTKEILPRSADDIVPIFTKTIIKRGDGGYQLIASPIGQVAPANVTNMTANSFDLYRFNANATLQWENYKQVGDDHYHFDLEPGRGYLYANSETVDLVFMGQEYSGNTLQVSLNAQSASGFKNWNLVGNPFAEIAHIQTAQGHTLNYYTVGVKDGQTNQYIPATNTSIQPMEGVFVIAIENGEKITFARGESETKSSQLALNINSSRNLVDRAIVRFDECRQLPKFQLNEDYTKVYIPMDGEDYAVVHGEEMGELPVNFKAEENGHYSLNLSSENVEFAYLHLIDNMTGNEVDLLQTPSYSFEAKTTDYASRFKLVYATGDNSNSDNFAFFSNGSFVINNDGIAELQVVDIMGRILSSETINGCSNVSVNAAPGVYMLRLVNGTDVKVQKVVVK